MWEFNSDPIQLPSGPCASLHLHVFFVPDSLEARLVKKGGRKRPIGTFCACVGKHYLLGAGCSLVVIFSDTAFP
jgi:hypothetical protein